MTLFIVMSEIGALTFFPGNTSSVPSSRSRFLSSLMTASDSGTRCGLPDFMRLPGISQVFDFKSKMLDVACETLRGKN
jgi:hypothetical protein